MIEINLNTTFTPSYNHAIFGYRKQYLLTVTIEDLWVIWQTFVKICPKKPSNIIISSAQLKVWYDFCSMQKIRDFQNIHFNH